MSQGVELDGSGRPVSRGGLKILVPKEYAAQTVVGVCWTCGTRFHKGEEAAWQRHVGPCARAVLDEIKTERAKRTDPFAVSWDPEVEQHLLAVGRRMQAEGRGEIKPNERAGFS